MYLFRNVEEVIETLNERIEYGKRNRDRLITLRDAYQGRASLPKWKQNDLEREVKYAGGVGHINTEINRFVGGIAMAETTIEMLKAINPDHPLARHERRPIVAKIAPPSVDAHPGLRPGSATTDGETIFLN